MLVQRSHQLYENSCFSQCACHHEKKNLVFSVIFADKRKSPRKSLEIHLFFLRGFFTLVKFACARLQINPTNLYVKDVDIRKYDRHISDQEILFDCFT